MKRTNWYQLGGDIYETPSVKSLEFLSEGLLCTSPFDENNRTELFDRLESEEL